MKLKGIAALRIPAFALALGLGAYAQAPLLITQPIDESKLVTLEGNTRPEVSADTDKGRVDDSLIIDHMLLLLRRSPQQEQAALKLIADLQDPKSPSYHKWLNSDQFGKQFGLNQQDLSTISRWLVSHGFEVNLTYKNGMLIDFTGTAGQVRSAFHTEMHNLLVQGDKHIANASDPKIPEALASAVVGIVSLHDFRPQPLVHMKSEYTAPIGSNTYYLVGPNDLAVIYQLTPLFKDTHPKTGKGQTVVLLEESDLFSDADFTSFRKAFGLNRFKGGNVKTVHPPSTGNNNCKDPGLNGAATEVAVDVEYATAAAPDATIEVASCVDTKTTPGLLLAMQNLLNATPPSIMSISYGGCEVGWGQSGNAMFNTTYQQAVTMGVSVFVSAGDAGAAGCNQNAPNSTNGIAVSAFASTVYDVAVGGTDFGDSYAGTNSTYWKSTNTKFYESAVSYVPEIPWNDSCASELIATFLGVPTTYGSAGFCNTSTAKKDGLINTAAGSGGPSGCATGKPKIGGVVSGSCAGWPKPTWQTLVGNPADGVRDTPDVSMFAANGVWGHFYPLCYSDTSNGGQPCTGAPNTWNGAGGTSFGAPILAGIQAIVNQVYGPQGNPNPIYYQLAAASYGASGNPACDSSLGNKVDRTCPFHDVTQGDMDVPCKEFFCYLPSGTYGVLSTDDKSYQPAYGTSVGWDFATGIGSINAARLVKDWKTVAP